MLFYYRSFVDWQETNLKREKIMTKRQKCLRVNEVSEQTESTWHLYNHVPFFLNSKHGLLIIEVSLLEQTKSQEAIANRLELGVF